MGSFSFNAELSFQQSSKEFRPIHYLGSKFRLLNFLEETFNSINPDGRIYDLFSGSGSVAFRMSKSRPVTAVDVQQYSHVINSALLFPISGNLPLEAFMQECINSQFGKQLLKAVEPLITYEAYCVKMASNGNPEPLCNLLEKGSIIAFEVQGLADESDDLFKVMNEAKNNLTRNNFLGNADALCTRYFGGLYFSYFQAVCMDTILHAIYSKSSKYHNVLLASLLSAVSNSVNTVGKQFAQPIRPRNSDGEPKPNLVKQIQKDRSIEVFQEFQSWVIKYTSIEPTKFKHKVLKMDFGEALDLLDIDTSIVYADPPYTRDHYSRFYHVLETICLKDSPALSKVVTNGLSQISRAVYREERHQSPFCIKSQAPAAFELLVSKTKAKQAALAISYSPFDESKKSHPRLLTMDQLIKIVRQFYRKVEIISPGEFVHSKLNNSGKHLEASSNAEILIVGFH